MPTSIDSQFAPIRDDITACKLKIAVLEKGQEAIKEQVKAVDLDVANMKLDLVRHTTRSNFVNTVIIIVATAIVQILVQNIFKSKDQAYVPNGHDHGETADRGATR